MNKNFQNQSQSFCDNNSFVPINVFEQNRQQAAKLFKLNFENNYYDILGVDQTSDIESIRDNYKQLCRKYHPDKCQGNPVEQLENREKFQQIVAAYKILSNEELKEIYDKTGYQGIQLFEQFF